MASKGQRFGGGLLEGTCLPHDHDGQSLRMGESISLQPVTIYRRCSIAGNLG
jgi:hypothetical protein